MAYGLPDRPPEELGDFPDSPDDCTCPECGWDRDEEAGDLQMAFNKGRLLAVEQAESSPFSMMGSTQLLALYWRCPEGHMFTTEEENSLGAMT